MKGLLEIHTPLEVKLSRQTRKKCLIKRKRSQSAVADGFG